MQEPASVGFSVLNLLVHFQGFSSFLVLIFYKLPLQPKGPYYEYVGLWTVYGLLAMNSWIWSTVFHSRWVVLYFSGHLCWSWRLTIKGPWFFCTAMYMFLSLFFTHFWKVSFAYLSEHFNQVKYQTFTSFVKIFKFCHPGKCSPWLIFCFS